MKLFTKTSAFSLVEVALAMGVASFALTGILSLLSVSLDSSKASTDDTVLATMANDVVVGLRRQPFDNAKQYIEAATPPVVFFDVAGKQIPDSGSGPATTSGPASNRSVYKCTITAQPDQNTLGTDGTTANMLRAKLIFQWPASAPSPAHTRVVHASIARY
jgi:uncharacterized protein (TIGR02598 family)